MLGTDGSVLVFDETPGHGEGQPATAVGGKRLEEGMQYRRGPGGIGDAHLDPRTLLDRALHSCQFWWASRRPMWDINMIQRGLDEQRAVVLNAAKAIRMAGSEDGRSRAEDLAAVSADLSRRITETLLA